MTKSEGDRVAAEEESVMKDGERQTEGGDTDGSASASLPVQVRQRSHGDGGTDEPYYSTEAALACTCAHTGTCTQVRRGTVKSFLHSPSANTEEKVL